MAEEVQEVEQEILKLVEKYYTLKFEERKFEPGKTYIPASLKVFDAEEIKYLVRSALEFNLTYGNFTKEFEKRLGEIFGLKYGMLVNSGSSANLLALSSLTSHKLGAKRLKKGDEVVTAAAGFPTTVNPIYQNNLIPVFVDSELGTYNVGSELIEDAITKKTKAIIISHTLGNPYDLDSISKIAKENDLFLIEDCCDALGSTFEGKHVGTFGNMATLSLYPAHHITTGEGGAVLTNNPGLKLILTSFRDWGRDCWCDPGKDNTCGKRFGWKLGELPLSYDHKYIYSHIGYNLKATEMQAAIGIPQIEKLPLFIRKRKENFRYLYENLKEFEDFIIMPKWHKKADPSWFGFTISVKPESMVKRNQLTEFLEANKIATRPLFAGNIVRQPAYLNMEKRIVGELKNADFIMENTFWIGIHPGIDKERLGYIVNKFNEFFKSR